jgi:hypothetical protein
LKRSHPALWSSAVATVIGLAAVTVVLGYGLWGPSRVQEAP